MEVEIDGETPRIPIGASTATDIGRATDLLSSLDRTVSRRHLSLRFVPQNEPDGEPIVFFQVIGKNPLLVVTTRDGEEKTEMYRTREKGQLRDGDKVSLSIKNPRFVQIRRIDLGALDAIKRREERTLKRRKQENGGGEEEEEEEEEELDLELGFERLDVSQYDPVKDFGFLVRGHEFDSFATKHKIRDWNWFLDDEGESSDDEDDGKASMSGKRKKKKKRKNEVDDDWEAGDSGGDENAPFKKSYKRPKYSTRSHDQIKQTKDAGSAKDSKDRKDDDGFIVNDEEPENDVSAEDEEEDFDDDNDDEDDEDGSSV